MMNSRKLVGCLALALCVGVTVSRVWGQDGAAPLPYLDVKTPVEARVADLFSRLTPDEKLSLLTGTGFTAQPIVRLKVPALFMADAGQGVRGGPEATCGPATAFPSGVAMAASWDRELTWRIGAAIGVEARNKSTGTQMMLGPAVNIHRMPLNGRNGEYLSEDPYLAARLAVAYIRGMQGAEGGGVGACVKHYACNNQERDRDVVDVKVSERALREIYLPAFEAAVKEGQVWAVMSSYNQINGAHASANHYLLVDVLKGDWGFDGVVMSDWGGVHSSVTVEAGNDLEMPGGEHNTLPKLKAALAAGTLTQAAVDDSAKRVLRAIVRVGLLDGKAVVPDSSKVNSAEHQRLSLEAAEKGIVLLKNEGAALPLDRSNVKSIAVIGEAATDMQVDALGSPEVQPFYKMQPLDGIKKLAGAGVGVTYVKGSPAVEGKFEAITVPGTGGGKQGFRAEYFKGKTLEGAVVAETVVNELKLNLDKKGFPEGLKTDFSARYTGELKAPTTGTYTFFLGGDDGFRMKIGDKTLIDRWEDGGDTTMTGSIELKAGESYPIEVDLFQSGGDAQIHFAWVPASADRYGDAVAAAKGAEVAVVFVSTRRGEGEGMDRESMDLPLDQDELVRAVAAANPRTVVVINNGTPVTMTKWIGQVPAVVEAFLPGQEGGNAIASVLFGETNPSGKLPTTFAARRSDYPDAPYSSKEGKVVKYDEGIYVGYRHFDKKEIAPLFPFGHGLSYTSFAYKDVQAVPNAQGNYSVSVAVTNAGKVAGEEVVQLYVGTPVADAPVRQLKGFQKVTLSPGETKIVMFEVTPRDLAFFDTPGKQWLAPAGEYEVQIGASSRDIRQKAKVTLNKAYSEAVTHSKAFYP